MLVADENPFDSAIEWLNGVDWDGVPRVKTFFETYFDVEPSEYTSAVSLYAWTALAGRVWQGDNLLIDDTLYGRSTAAYRHGYDVDCSDESLRVEYNRPDLKGLSVTACIA
ncbi:Virulence-associated protein E [Sodalis glossinidius str. 'morsitans']|uniref:Virulence-associated protein E n=1 Tax=Sodalis glossinidius (strain morsitans) TaxID=343509 RepID=A0A193QIV8_SODGM|nr:VapE domain-containing protein [Sodalis glossinidius]CRL45117.1 Virulence-associated protein E [Sodalis glossinidius str. 'morsitans']